jgi:lipid-A-disaccharide synthase
LRIAKFAKAKGLRVFWYISPKVWAWNQNRAWRLKENIDRMFTILPFEKEFYKKFDWTVDYVGNPVLDAIKNYEPDSDFLNKHEFSTVDLIALLPGSRKQELKRIVPLMAEVVKLNPNLQFGVATVGNLDETLYEPLTKFGNVRLVYDRTYDLLSHSRAAVVTSGTATLETALWKVPQVVVYRLRSIEYMVLKRLVKVPYISLVNLIANKEVVRELIHDKANAIDLDKELQRLLDVESYREQMLSEYDRIYNTLDIGSASQNTAELMLRYLGK